MSNTVHAFDYLDAPSKFKPAAFCVAFGDEPFLKRLAMAEMRHSVLGDDADVPFASFEGKTAEWRDVIDELSTVALFGGARLVVIDEADEFVTRQREDLEEYVDRPSPGAVLILDVRSWPKNTRLYKAINKVGLQIECRAPEIQSGSNKFPDDRQICKWVIDWGAKHHNIKLARPAAQVLFELVGPDLGLLDQELAKLALYVGTAGEVTEDLVKNVVGGWRAKTIWELADAAVEGNSAEALRQLDRLLQSGEHPAAYFGQIAWSLRRYAKATRIYEAAERGGRKVKLRDAAAQAGFRHWKKDEMDFAEESLNQLGRERAGRLYRWLLDVDLALKGSHSTTDRGRLMLEQLLVRLCQQLKPTRRKRPTALPT